MQPPYESENSIFRNLFRAGAMIFLPTGAIFTAIGLIDFFGSFSGHGFPTKFWCVFIGFPMLALGTFCFNAGFLRRITGYVAGEVAPVVKDTVEYVADSLMLTGSSSKATRPDDPATRMQMLDELKNRGMISESEYSTKRDEILKEI